MSPLFVGPANSTNKFLGNLSSDPSSGNVEGDMYYNTTGNELKTYDGSGWRAVLQQSVVTTNLQVWFDPRKFSSLSNGATATSNDSCIIPSTTWKLYTNGTASFVSGTANQAIQSSGTSALAFWTDGTDVTAFDGVDNYTFEFWIYVGTQDINNWGYLMGKSSFWGANDAGIFINSDGANWGAHSATSPMTVADIQANGWHHVVYVRNLSDGNCRKFYVDNNIYIQDNTGDGDSAHTLNNNCALTVGGSSSGNNNSYSNPAYSPGNGYKYGHARFYNIALTAQQITQNYNAERAIYGV